MGTDRIPGLVGIVVAGGKSTRFGTDKASAILAGRPLLHWVCTALAEVCVSLVVVRARGRPLPAVEVPVPVRPVEDEYEGLGPLAGLVTGFAAALDHELAMTASCDVPLLRPGLARGLASLAAGHDIVIPHVGGFPQPLLALYRPTTCLGPFRRAVEAGDLKITAAYRGLRVRRVSEEEVRAWDPDLASFLNVNRVEELRDLERRLGDRQ